MPGYLRDQRLLERFETLKQIAKAHCSLHASHYCVIGHHLGLNS